MTLGTLHICTVLADETPSSSPPSVAYTHLPTPIASSVSKTSLGLYRPAMTRVQVLVCILVLAGRCWLAPILTATNPHAMQMVSISKQKSGKQMCIIYREMFSMAHLAQRALRQGRAAELGRGAVGPPPQ